MTDNSWRDSYDQVVYLLQGGGALGSYQVGIYQGLLERNCEPTWVIGTSIGGINGAIIAGNKPEDRLPRLKQFWDTITVFVPDFFPGLFDDQFRSMQNMAVSQWSSMFGISGFFTPRMENPWLEMDTTPDKLSFYDTTELHTTLEKVIDFNILNSKKIRLTVSAVCLNDGNLVRFDNTKEEITPKHIMATAALPPGLPAVKIGTKYYWDGGLTTNTPFEVLLEEPLAKNLLCFVVNLFAYAEHLPKNLTGVLKRKKDLEFISQHRALLHYFCQLQRYSQEIRLLYSLIPNQDQYPEVKAIYEQQSSLTLNIARFHYKDRPCDLWSKDFEFSQESLHDRFKQGYQDVIQAFKDPAWLKLMPETIQLHNF